MPIYVYRCENCQKESEALQKISEAPLIICSHCGQPTLKKALTAPGFQLKGSGWYASDFKGGTKAAPTEDASANKKDESASSESKPAAPAACATGCACH